MSTFFTAPHVDSDVSCVIKLLLGIHNNRPYENLASLSSTLLNQRTSGDVMEVFAQLSLVNTGAVAAEDFVDWFNQHAPEQGLAPRSMSTGYTLGEYIAQKRKLLGMTQTDLASRVSVAVSQVCRWEADGGQPSARAYKRLGVVLNVEPSRLWEMANMDVV